MSILLPLAGPGGCFGLPLSMGNRHGLIAGATGTGKTVTLQTLAEAFSRAGVAVFLADVKGDLTGLGQTGGGNPKVEARVADLQLTGHRPEAFPVCLWDVWGKDGHPVRTTVSEIGPLLLSRLLDLNPTQTGVLQALFQYADDEGLLLLDLKDLTSLLQHAGDNASALRTRYGNFSATTLGAIRRGLMGLEQQGGEALFGEPALDLPSLLQTDPAGRGLVHILSVGRLMQESPRVYATLMLWLLSELFEELPETGDADRPRLAFFFDEAHLLFNDLPKALGEKVEQVVRLIRSKGVGVYFVTQSPSDLPEAVLGQLGHRVQHALRAFTPKDQKAVRTAAQTLRPNPGLDAEAVITELGVGEALVSFLDAQGRPTPVERALIVPPCSHIGPADPALRQQLLAASPFRGRYEQAIDRESAYERLQQAAQRAALAPSAPAPLPNRPDPGGTNDAEMREALGRARPRNTSPAAPHERAPARSRGDSFAEAFAKSALRSIGSSVGRSLVRGLLGSLTRR